MKVHNKLVRDKIFRIIEEGRRTRQIYREDIFRVRRGMKKIEIKRGFRLWEDME